MEERNQKLQNKAGDFDRDEWETRYNLQLKTREEKKRILEEKNKMKATQGCTFKPKLVTSVPKTNRLANRRLSGGAIARTNNGVQEASGTG